MPKHRKTPQDVKQGARGRPNPRNETTGQANVSGNVLNGLRQARTELFSSVAQPPFDILVAPPLEFDGEPLLAHVERCRVWHNRAQMAFNKAWTACREPLGAEGLGALPLYLVIGYPDFGDTEDNPSKNASRFMLSYEARARYRNAEVAKRSSGSGVYCLPGPLAHHLCLDIRRRALDFCDWLDRAVSRLESAILPQIEIGPELRPGVHKLVVLLAGYPAPDAATEIPANVARDLLRFHKGAGKAVKIDNADAQAGKIRSLIPQLNADTGRLIRHGDNAYRLHEAMIGRIDGRNSGIRL